MRKISVFILVVVLFIACKIFKDEVDNETHNESKDILKINPGVYIANLPEGLSDSSGLIYYNDLFWSFNDSGGDNKICAFNKQGQIQKEVELINAGNVDWEDIAQDDLYLYIDDFGNNSGTRKILKIYKISKDEIGTGKKQGITGEEISFSYNNQGEFSF